MSASGSMRSLVALGLLALAGTVNAVEGGDPFKEGLTEAECEQLVEQLANPGKRPFDGYVHVLPRSIDRDELHRIQRKIGAAYDRLSENIEASLPFLMKHIDDKRFSYVYEDGVSGVYETANVGTACRRIVVAHVEVYRDAVTETDADGHSQSLWFLLDGCGGIESWWKTRRGKTLAELQREGIEWALHHKRPDYFSKRQWTAAQRTLKKMAEKIRTSKEPLRVKHKVQFFSK